MKLRIKGNTLRMRLLRSEVAGFCDRGTISESINFGPSDSGSLAYSLVRSDTAGEVLAEFDGSEIRIILPAHKADKWTGGEDVGIEAEIVAEGESLRILIEKDFVCLTRTDDPDNEDAYPHPDEKC